MKNQPKKQVKSSLSERALLVNINISQWTARRADKTATETVMNTHKTQLSAGNYNKKLLPNAKELEAVATVATQIRKFFYDQTLPWLTDGSRIIAGSNHLKFAAELRKMISEFESCVSSFEAAYPRLQAEAQKTLGDLYQPTEYPAPSEIKEKFKCDVSYFPMPDSKDFRVQISDSEKRAFEKKMREAESTAMRSVWERLHGVVKSAAEKLAAPDAIFRDSLLDNVKELCDLLPALNVSQDAKLEAASKEVKKLISGMSADTIRTDKNVRKDAAKKLKDITEKMSAFAGVAK